MPLTAGIRLGPYEILEEIGAGGMGEVYRARDTRLDRIVAIKVLSSQVSAQTELKERFEREARTISSLSHPHICSLYDIGQQDGINYLVMEFLEGETLAERLNSKGTLSTELVLRYGIQIADALEKAHKQGIVHRDLKPGNIMLTKSGVKLLDFGLAKLQVPINNQILSGVSALPTEQRDLTAAGTILGTLQYMSPEQLEGRECDARTDIFALGTVLHEMATGKKAFTGKSQASLIAAILSSEPQPVSAIQPTSPPALDRVVKTCLAKDPDDRWQTAHDVMVQLNWIAEDRSTPIAQLPVRTHRMRRAFFPWAAACVFFVAALILAIAYLQKKPQQSGTYRLSINPPENTSLAGSMALSPDGSRLAFTVLDSNGVSSLWVRPLDSLVSQSFPGTEDAQFPFWSPDGRSLGFFAGSKVKKIEIAGGPPVILADVTVDARGGTWNRSGEILFSPGFQSAIYRIQAAGGKAEPATILNREREERSHRWPVFLPDGEHFFYLMLGGKGETGSVYIGSLKSKEPKFFLKVNSRMVFAPPDKVLFMRGQTLIAQHFDQKKLVLDGEPFPVADHVAISPGISGFAAFSVSENAILSYRTQSNPLSQLMWFDRSGHELERLGVPGHYLGPRISSDGKRLAIAQQDIQSHNSDLWIFDLVRHSTSRFTFEPADDFGPVWSPDDRQIAFQSDRSGVHQLYLKNADGTGGDQLLLKSNIFDIAEDWSSDGRFILFSRLDPIKRFDMWILPLFGDKTPFLFVTTPFGECCGQFSPDGRWIAYSSNESGRGQIYVRPFPGPGQAMQISIGGGSAPRWRKDGKELFYVAPDGKLMAVKVQTSTSLQVSVPAALFDAEMAEAPDAQYAVSADGQRFLVVKNLEGKKPGSITIVLNWDQKTPS